MIRELRRQRVEAAPFSALERDARVEKVLVRLREGCGHAEAEGGKTREREYESPKCAAHAAFSATRRHEGNPEC